MFLLNKFWKQKPFQLCGSIFSFHFGSFTLLTFDIGGYHLNDQCLDDQMAKRPAGNFVSLVRWPEVSTMMLNSFGDIHLFDKLDQSINRDSKGESVFGFFQIQIEWFQQQKLNKKIKNSVVSTIFCKKLYKRKKTTTTINDIGIYVASGNDDDWIKRDTDRESTVLLNPGYISFFWLACVRRIIFSFSLLFHLLS